MLTSLNNTRRRKFHRLHKIILLMSSILCGSIFLLSYFHLEFCFKILTQNSLNNMCNRYQRNEYSGTLCHELCVEKSFKNFKCPEKFNSAYFTAVQNYNTYAIKIAKDNNDYVNWKDKKGYKQYPKIQDFQNIVKQYFTISYNLTMNEDAINDLFNQEIDLKSPEQLKSIWRIYKDNNYMMGKLYEKQSIFPRIIGNCGPFYSTEYLNPISLSLSGIRQFITTDWIGRLRFAMIILEYLYKLNEIKPEQLTICKIKTKNFGITMDKRLKYQNAYYIFPQSHLDKMLSDGSYCTTDKNCIYESCIGKCDLTQNTCTGIQQNNNYQIVCQEIFRGYRYFPGLLSTNKTPPTLFNLIDICIDPSKNSKHHVLNRTLAPSEEITQQLYNEIRRIYNEETFYE